MLLAMDFRRQARVCARLAECDDHHLADRFKSMAADLLAKAEAIREELRRPWNEDRKRAVASMIIGAKSSQPMDGSTIRVCARALAGSARNAPTIPARQNRPMHAEFTLA